MAKYAYKGIGRDGKQASGTIAAGSAEEVSRMLCQGMGQVGAALHLVADVRQDLAQVFVVGLLGQDVETLHER